MKKIIDYRLITGLNIDLLEPDINQVIKLGYSPYGAPYMALISGSYTNCQAVVLYRSWRIWRSKKRVISRIQEIQKINSDIQVLKPEEEL
jgi:hypothetical protein